jgi:hypothetical protein
MSWMRIRLELARAPGFPEGSHRHGYNFVLPLQADGRFDRKAYDKTPELCTVHRFWDGEEDKTGEILHTARGRWVFSYEPEGAYDEPAVLFDKHVFRPGEYVTVREARGPEHAFSVITVEPSPGIAPVRPR